MIGNCRKIFVISSEDKQDFIAHKFIHNNINIMILALFLMIEQAYYGVFVSEQGSLIQKMYFFSSCVMFIYVLMGVAFYKKKPDSISIAERIYELSFGIFGFLIAIARILLIQNNFFSLPTIFIAVVYGFAVIFYFHPIENLLIYLFMALIVIGLLPIFQADVILGNFRADILSNSLIAWIVSVINYQKYAKEYNNQKTIEKNNQELKTKTLQIEKINKKLEEISVKDELTKIYNRRKIDEIVKHEYDIAHNNDQVFSVIMLDLDRFKLVNDTYGHNVGDKVLVEIAEILRNNIRNGDTVGRWGGEEFIIICSGTNAKQALRLSERLRNAIENYEFSEIKHITCSFGVSTYNGEESIEKIINKADQGLYKAKENGRNLVKISG